MIKYFLLLLFFVSTIKVYGNEEKTYICFFKNTKNLLTVNGEIYKKDNLKDYERSNGIETVILTIDENQQTGSISNFKWSGSTKKLLNKEFTDSLEIKDKDIIFKKYDEEFIDGKWKKIKAEDGIIRGSVYKINKENLTIRMMRFWGKGKSSSRDGMISEGICSMR